MEHFRFLHISDLHISAKLSDHQNPISGGQFKKRDFLRLFFNLKEYSYPSTFSKDVAISLSQFIHDMRNEIDGILISGDISTTGTDSDLEFASDFLLGDVDINWSSGFAIKSIINQSCSTGIIPGNHDRYSDGVLSFPGSSNFEKYFGSDWQISNKQLNIIVEEVGNTGKIKLLKYKKENEILLIYCIDFSLKYESESMSTSNSVAGHFGQGIVNPTVLEQLITNTKLETIKNNAPALWMVHFPPKCTEVNKWEKLQLINDDLLINAANDCNVEYLLTGHTHKEDRYDAVSTNSSKVNVVCAGTACCVENENEINKLYELNIKIDNGKIISLVENSISYDDDTNEFN